MRSFRLPKTLSLSSRKRRVLGVWCFFSKNKICFSLYGTCFPRHFQARSKRRGTVAVFFIFFCVVDSYNVIINYWVHPTAFSTGSSCYATLLINAVNDFFKLCASLLQAKVPAPTWKTITGWKTQLWSAGISRFAIKWAYKSTSCQAYAVRHLQPSQLDACVICSRAY